MCSEQKCGDLKDRPLLELGATVYIVFGINHVNKSKHDEGHVLDQLKVSLGLSMGARGVTS